MAMNIVLINMTGGFFKNTILLLLLCACPRLPLGYPHFKLLNGVPDGPPEFQYGWSQGCNTGASGFASEFYRSTGGSKFEKDFIFADKSPDYEIGWQIGFWYCMRTVERHDGRRRDGYPGI